MLAAVPLNAALCRLVRGYSVGANAATPDLWGFCGAVIVDLWAPWCGPCRMVSPALEQLARDLAGQVKLVKVNVDTSPRISQRFGAQAILRLRCPAQSG